MPQRHIYFSKADMERLERLKAAWELSYAQTIAKALEQAEEHSKND